MAKCIKYVSNETFARVSNMDALEAVLAGAAHYTSKSAYHAWLGEMDKAIRKDSLRLSRIATGWEPPAPRKNRKTRKQRGHKW